ncbi:MAG: family transporter [Acidimicrobiaceae bacterium]|nr:family transporter [Acidimicrobiaceae bacterium]
MGGTRSTSPVAAVLAGASCIAASAILVRLSGSSATAAAFFRCAFALPVLAVLVRIDRNSPARIPMSRRATWIARLAGAFLAGDLVLWSHSIAAVGAGLATVLGNLQVLVVGILAWALLGERLAPSLKAALPLMAAGVGLVGGLVGSRSYGAHPGLGVIFGAATSACYAAFILLLRHVMATMPEQARPASTGIVRPLFEATCGAALTAAALGLALRDFRIGPVWPALGWLALLAVSSQVIGWILITSSLASLPAALTSTLLLVQPVGAVALGAIVFGEHPSPVQLAGVGLILVGVVVATAGEQFVRRFRSGLLQGNELVAADIAAPRNAGGGKVPG